MAIILINEQQYKDLFLNETMHYPVFLDKLKDFVSAQLHIEIENRLKNKETEFTFNLPIQSEYSDNIIFDVKIDENSDIKDRKQYRCFYYNQYNTLINNKLNNPIIYVSCPSKNRKIAFPMLKTVISHELTHLYDDWQQLSLDNVGINFNDKNIGTTEFVNDSLKNGNNLYKSLSMLSYMSLKTERQAFLSQTVQELQQLGCTFNNYKQKVKETILYNNITKSYEEVKTMINNATEYELYNCNQYILLIHPKAELPKYDMGQFNCNRYRTMLSKWVEKVFHNTMKLYGSVVQYYLNLLEEQSRKMNDIVIY